MPHRIEIKYKIPDARAQVRKKKLESLAPVGEVELVDVYTIEQEISPEELRAVAESLANPVVQQHTIDESRAPETFGHAIEVGFLPGVTDNVGNTVKTVNMQDLLKKDFDGQTAYASQVTFLSGNLAEKDAKAVAYTLHNPVIQRTHIKGFEKFVSERGMGTVVPQVKLDAKPTADIVDILNADEDELKTIGKQGIFDKEQNTRRGPLALDSIYMRSIQDYFRKKERNPTDVELESIAQTWSEHCKHTIFADPIDDIQEGLFKRYLKRATEDIRKQKDDEDFCVSVFTDNSGGIAFDENHIITHKAETHNSPSALDPFGGAITGIVGVNRDAIGFGLGAKPVINTYGFCFGDPRDPRSLYKGDGKTQKMLSPRRILEGVVEGVNVGGNCSGIPTPQGFVLFEDRYRGKPLVFVGTVGLIPRESAGRKSHEKKALHGDYIVMIGGKVGKDGIHGATFSSEAIDSGSPATAVQIGDPITQKKLSDAVVTEARDLELYTSITDNGAGGLSCSVAEMAKESNGCYVQLDKVPVKYPGLKPWEIWVSESQERMTLSVPKDKWEKFSELMGRRGVEATVIGEFTDSGKCVVDYEKTNVMDIDLDFLHDGLPPRPMKTTFTKQKHKEPKIPMLEDLTSTMYELLGRLNISSFEFISQQYDHEVQGCSVLKPLQGRGRVNADATVTKPVLDSDKGVVLSQGILPWYSDIDTYDMAACSIDTAVRNAVSAGADIDKLAILDNFCWCSSNEPERLGQLKRAAEACYDIAVEYGTPFISGKDSMFNDFKGYDEDGKPVKISVPPTLLISSIGVMEDAGKSVSLDAKFEGDLIYILGETHDELGASEYFAIFGEHERDSAYIGNSVPKVDAKRNKELYTALSKCIDEELVASAQSVGRGGLAVALAKTAMGGKRGLEVSLKDLPGSASRDDYALFSESMGRIVVTVGPLYKERFEELMQGNSYAQIGTVTKDTVVIKGKEGKEIMKADVDEMLKRYKTTLRDY